MFEFLKNKLKQVVSRFTKKIEQEAKPVEIAEPPTKELPPKEKAEPRREQPRPEPKKEEPREPPEPRIEEIPRKEEKKIEEPRIIEEIKPKIQDQKEKTEEPKPELKEPPKEEKHSFFDFLKKKEPEHREPEPQKEIKREIIEEKPSPKEEPKEEKRNIFEIVREKITKQTINESQFEEMFSDLEMVLLENSVALEVIDKIKADLKTELVDKPLERGKIEAVIESSLKKTIEDLFDVQKIDLLSRIREKKPYIICFVGINGSGKTTTIAKIAHLLKKKGISSVMAASDTFRAAAIQQLEEHANRLDIKLIKHDYGADSAAVAFDAISHAKAHNIDVVLIDTAGRMQSNTNLMDEIKKVKRVTKPDLVVFVGESITGNDCIEQAKTFDQQLGIDAIILAKSDVDEKGGAAISISYVTKKPIMYIGTGQGYDDLIEFDPKIIIKSLGLET